MSISDLPLEILIKIALESPKTFRQMLALRPVAEFMHSNRKWVLDKFTIVRNIGSHITYFIAGKIHREDGPAIEWTNGTKEWYWMGKLHRDGDLPAVECKNGHKEWYQHGSSHRDNDLPAIIRSYGVKEWWQHGKKHRDGDLPAYKHKGYKAWWHYGQRHRDGLPAIIWPDGALEYWVNNERIDE